MVVVPCYWHRRIEAGDLGSHTYNAWLADLATTGRAPGLHVVWQWQNVLVDWGLSLLARPFGWIAAEKIVVAACVLCFFWGAFAGPGPHGILFTGADQLMIFGPTYILLSRVLLVLGTIAFLVAAIQDRKHSPVLRQAWTPLTLWALLVATAMLLPDAVWLPQYISPVSAIVARITSVTAVIGLCAVASLRPRRWILGSLVVAAAIFFKLQYRDTSVLNRMEQQAESLVSALPYGTRVSYSIDLHPEIRTNFRHLIDRACIERCFTYSNYEPGTGQFRVRLDPQGSPLVSGSSTEGLAMELGEFIVRPEDLPMIQIYQPNESDLTQLALRTLVAGEKNGRVGHHPPREEIAERLPDAAK